MLVAYDQIDSGLNENGPCLVSLVEVDSPKAQWLWEYAAEPIEGASGIGAPIGHKADDNRSALALQPFGVAAAVLAVALGVGRFAYPPLSSRRQ